ncbi:hypothetical protein SAMN02745146_0777 [Hymenobacter daecheongensis DSM 21074]|uniref:Lipoprotein n=1 Tax=Hymenobacter daecheongensis DSM 21074 TaxID=1121955 RepID=A0A1M6AV70_9BACT|nr:hypothetical protein [Hymenobacter daecheongensis]SHI40350.1 hypothetical protein SAMN02745146_0777 [Hymenobacter daecheongensis DSM 21074]
MTKNLLLSGLALATLALNACSSEPSDYRPDKKVSLDMVAPGTRSSDNFDPASAEAPHQSKGAAISHPISTNSAVDEADVDVHNKPAAAGAMSENAEQVERTKKGSDAAKMKAEPHKMPTGTTGGQLEEE